MAQQLFDEFEEVSAKAWKQQIQYDLKGADYNDTLLWESPEGIKVKPFYHKEGLKYNAQTRTTNNNSWKIGQAIYAGNEKKTNLKALSVLQKGAESLIFTIPSEDLKVGELLKNIDLNAVPVHFDFQFLSADIFGRMQDLSETIHSEIHVNLDIIGNLARNGNWFFDQKKDFEVLEQIASKYAFEECSSLLSIDLSLYQNAGANRVQQLAYALAHANEYLNHALLKPSQGITFKVSIGPNYFFEIAKLRALRILWGTLAKEYGVSPHCHIIATPSKRNKTLYDYNVNLLRTTSECMSAIFGGADTVYNLPYDAIYHKDNEFGERIARNQLLIMKSEGYLDKVGNVAAGAYYIETLTHHLAEKALALFKNIEAGGGFLKQLKNHTIQKKIKESAKKEQQLFDEGKTALVGTNKYQNQKDRMTNDVELYPFLKTDKRKTLIEPIFESRLAEKLEQIRLKDE